MPANLKVNCDRSALVDALTMASGVVPSRTTTPVLTCLKLSAKEGELHLRATDGQISLTLAVPSVEVVSDGEALIPADKLNQIVRTCEDSTVAIEIEKNVATVKGEGSIFKIFGYDPKEYPAGREPQPTGAFEVTAESLRRLIARTLFATAVENARFAINGVLMERKGKRIRLVGTDGKRLAVAAGACTGEGDMTFIVPSKSLNILVKMLGDPDAKVVIGHADGQAVFQVEGAGTLVTSLVEGTFPPFEDVIPKDHDKRVSFDATDLATAIRRAALLTNEESKGVRFAFKGDTLVVSSRAPEMGEAEIRVPMSGYQGDAIEIGFQPNFIVDALKVVDGQQVMIEMRTPQKPGVLKVGQEFTYVVMPVNVG
ncbi:MAG: DNA polymerase III subunit beta [Phycisphaerales bacterium]